MSIVWNRDQINYNWGKDVPEDQRRVVTHSANVAYYEGRVVHYGVDHNVQVMSDVWEDIGYLIVLNDKDQFQKISLHAYEVASYEVDADAALLSRYAAHAAASEAAARERARKEEERRYEMRRAHAQVEARTRILSTFEKGTEVKVIKGRKIPIGTTGKVVWVGESEYGTRVGIRDEVTGNVVFTAASNVERADATVIALLCNGDWLGYENKLIEAKYAEATKIATAFPLKGDKVKTACGKVGKVFWKADDGKRVGVKVGPNREDVVWANSETLSAA